jgi:hypothetical protein
MAALTTKTAKEDGGLAFWELAIPLSSNRYWRRLRKRFRFLLETNPIPDPLPHKPSL